MMVFLSAGAAPLTLNRSTLEAEEGDSEGSLIYRVSNNIPMSQLRTPGLGKGRDSNLAGAEDPGTSSSSQKGLERSDPHGSSVTAPC